MTKQEAIDWLNKSPDNAIKVNSWCVKTVEQLLDARGNLCMEVVGRGSECRLRSNSILKEIEEHPERCSLISINGDHDTSFTDEVMCPYCGHEHRDSFEFRDSGDHECDFCGKTFEFYRDVSVSYSSHKKE